MSRANVVNDMNGKPIDKGASVIVHQIEEVRRAKVVDVFPDRPTNNDVGYWIDIDFGGGSEGMMSYIVEVID